MKMNKEQVLERVKEEQIEFVRVEFLDYAGVTRGRTIRPAQLKDALETGINFSTAIMSFDVLDEYIADYTYGPHDGDFFAVPDPATFTILPHRDKTARMLCNLVDEHGDPWPGCPRHALQRLLQEAERLLGGQMYMAFEQEAYLLREEDGRLVPADESHCFSIEGADIQEAFLHRFVQALEAMGVRTEQISSEYGPGQLEVNLRYAPALQATDDQVTFAHLFKEVARDLGMVGTLMPKPFPHLAGSGLHVHLSLYDENGENLFEDLTDQRGLDLSEKAYHFIGGLLRHASSLVAIGAPSMNSYKRMLPGSWAPAHVCYGAGNRSVLVRIPEKRRARRFEYRGADGTCNPYLLAACLVAAGLDGIQNRIDPGDPVTCDVAQLSEQERQDRGIGLLPRSLRQAIAALAADTILAETIGRPIWEEFIKIKRSEWEKFSRHVSDWERQIFARRF